jgi:hypothetical protein
MREQFRQSGAEVRVAEPGHDGLATAYRRFAHEEARGRSALYESLARLTADDPDLLQLLAGLPQSKRQPNLLFAAVRLTGGVQLDWPRIRDAMLTRWTEIRDVMLTHSTQTNEPGRCAVLLPVLAQLPQPLALIEVGASAGLCLLPVGIEGHLGVWRPGRGRTSDVLCPAVAWRCCYLLRQFFQIRREP